MLDNRLRHQICAVLFTNRVAIELGVSCARWATHVPEVAALLDTLCELIEALRRSALLAERLVARASLTTDEARDVRHEIQTVRDFAERMEAMITLRRQNLRPM